MWGQSIFKKMNASAFIFLFAIVCISVFINIPGVLSSVQTQDEILTDSPVGEETKNVESKMHQIRARLVKILEWFKKMLSKILTQINEMWKKSKQRFTKQKQEQQQEEQEGQQLEEQEGQQQVQEGQQLEEQEGQQQVQEGQQLEEQEGQQLEEQEGQQREQEVQQQEQQEEEQEEEQKEHISLNFDTTFGMEKNYNDKKYVKFAFSAGRFRTSPAFDLLTKKCRVNILNSGLVKVQIGEKTKLYSAALFKCACIIRSNYLDFVKPYIAKKFVAKFVEASLMKQERSPAGQEILQDALKLIGDPIIDIV